MPTGEAAKRELDDALRSLGLHRDQLQQNAVQKGLDARPEARATAGRCRSNIRSGCGLTTRASRVRTMASRMHGEYELGQRMSFCDRRPRIMLWCRFIPSGFRTISPTC